MSDRVRESFVRDTVEEPDTDLERASCDRVGDSVADCTVCDTSLDSELERVSEVVKLLDIVLVAVSDTDFDRAGNETVSESVPLREIDSSDVAENAVRLSDCDTVFETVTEAIVVDLDCVGSIDGVNVAVSLIVADVETDLDSVRGYESEKDEVPDLESDMDVS